MLDHIELWVPDLDRATGSWGWLLGSLGWTPYQNWPDGRSRRLGETYVVVERPPAMRGGGAGYDRMRPGLNHLAFHAPGRTTVDTLTGAAPAHGWTLLFPDRHPFAGARTTACRAPTKATKARRRKVRVALAGALQSRECIHQLAKEL